MIINFIADYKNIVLSRKLTNLFEELTVINFYIIKRKDLFFENKDIE